MAILPPLTRISHQKIVTRSVSEGGAASYAALRFMQHVDTTSNRTALINRGASLAYASGYYGLVEMWAKLRITQERSKVSGKVCRLFRRGWITRE
jgi:hypothetical protein